MFRPIEKAFQAQDYRQVAALLRELQRDDPHNPWVHFYSGQLYEMTGKRGVAEKLYRQTLKQATFPKIMARARQGLQRLERQAQEQRQGAIARAIAQKGGDRLGIFLLEALPSDRKKVAAQEMAQVLQINPYQARLQIPHRSWRLYRVGPIGELQYYVSQLRSRQVPCFCAPLSLCQQVIVRQVQYFTAWEDRFTCVYTTGNRSKPQTLTLPWSAVGQQVQGLVPLLQESVQVNLQREFYRKTMIQDYAYICDLHVKKFRVILRICEQQYQFGQGIPLREAAGSAIAMDHRSLRQKWNQLQGKLNHTLAGVPLWNEFLQFGEKAIEFPETLKTIEHQVPIKRAIAHAQTPWDPAFHLYSCLAYLRGFSPAYRSYNPHSPP